MNTKSASVSSLMLTEDEAFGLLDMCLMSSAETDCHKEAAMQKLKEVIYGFFAAEAAETDRVSLPGDAEAIPMTDVLACIEANDAGAMDEWEATVRVTMREHTGRFFFREIIASR